VPGAERPAGRLLRVAERRRDAAPDRLIGIDEKTIWNLARWARILRDVKAVYLAIYLFGFCLAGPMLAVTAVAYAQQADFAVALGALVALAVVWKGTAASWRRLPG
jgi:hypothetical protein